MKLKELCGIKSGYQGKMQEGEKYEIIKMKDVEKDGVINYKDLETFDTEKEPTKFLLQKGDVILKARSGDNTAALINEDVENVVAAPHFMILKIKSIEEIESELKKEKLNMEYKHMELQPGYLELYLNSEYAQEYFKTNSEGTTLPIIKSKTLGELDIKLIPKDEQLKLIEAYNLVKLERRYMEELAKKREDQFTAYLRSFLD